MTKDRAREKAKKYIEWADKAEQKSKDLHATFQAVYKNFDWTQPILRGHHSQRRHEKVFDHREAMMNKTVELDTKAKRFREKAVNLTAFANRNAGDAECQREEKRKIADQAITIGSQVVDWCFGSGIVERVNKKTYTIRFSSGYKCARDKSYLKL